MSLFKYVIVSALVLAHVQSGTAKEEEYTGPYRSIYFYHDFFWNGCDSGLIGTQATEEPDPVDGMARSWWTEHPSTGAIGQPAGHWNLTGMSCSPGNRITFHVEAPLEHIADYYSLYPGECKEQWYIEYGWEGGVWVEISRTLRETHRLRCAGPPALDLKPSNAIHESIFQPSQDSDGSTTFQIPERGRTRKLTAAIIREAAWLTLKSMGFDILIRPIQLLQLFYKGADKFDALIDDAATISAKTVGHEINQYREFKAKLTMDFLNPPATEDSLRRHTTKAATTNSTISFSIFNADNSTLHISLNYEDIPVTWFYLQINGTNDPLDTIQLEMAFNVTTVLRDDVIGTPASAQSPESTPTSAARRVGDFYIISYVSMFILLTFHLAGRHDFE
jgi:hypothetical protein